MRLPSIKLRTSRSPFQGYKKSAELRIFYNPSIIAKTLASHLRWMFAKQSVRIPKHRASSKLQDLELPGKIICPKALAKQKGYSNYLTLIESRKCITTFGLLASVLPRTRFSALVLLRSRSVARSSLGRYSPLSTSK
jgi:hypothetical protein